MGFWPCDVSALRDKERRRREALLPNHSTVRLAGAGHYLQSDAPQEFTDAIRTWHAILQPDPDADRTAPLPGETA